MREILFRGKAVQNAEWVHGDLVEEKWGHCIQFVDVMGRTKVTIMKSTAGQYTGVKDKNGRKVFEGDIVRYIYEPGKGFWNANQLSIIEWKSTGFYMRGIMGTNKYACMDGWLTTIPYSSENFEVVGNIYDNPELIP